MLTLARLSIRRPRAALAAWLAIAVVLAMIGVGVSSALSPSVTVVPGTQSARAQSLAQAQFGPTQLVPILLEGPKVLLNEEGPALVAQIARRPDTRVLSAWDAGSESAALRPRPTAAMMIVSVDRSINDAVKYDEPQIEALVARQIKAPVRSYITGQPALDRAEQSASLSNLRRDEAIAVGILLLLLLVGLRAPVAALLVTAVGAISMLACFGEIDLLGHVLTLDPVGLAAGTMTGLAFAVAFALMMLDRFHREEHADAEHPRDAATAAIVDLEGTGRAILIAGTALVLALALVAIIGPTELMVSVGAGALTCAAFATGGAVVVMPAALVLLGRRIDALSFPAPPLASRAWSRLLDGGNVVTRHAAGMGIIATALLVAIALPALALRSGPESINLLPSGAKARIALQEISRVMGPGYATPYSLIVVADNGPITTPALLASLNRFQMQVATDRTVDSVTGPGEINSTSAQLKSFEPSLNHSMKISDQSKTQLLQLIKGLAEAGSGSKQLQAGLESASSGASQLQTGGGSATSGAAELHAGLATAQTGSAALQGGLNQALTAAQELKTGAGEALTGANQLVEGISLAQSPAAQSVSSLNSLSSWTQKTDSDVGSALALLESMTAGKSDPRYSAVLSALQAASSDASQAKSQAGTLAYQAPGLVAALSLLHNGASQLVSGISQLRSGDAQLATGIGQLSAGGDQLSSGLSQLTAGAGSLQDGLALLTNGAGQLAYGLTSGIAPAGQLATGLGTMQAAVVKSRGQIPSTAQLRQLERESPGLFNSGYFVLAAVAGATRNNRNAATFTLNLLQGGTAGQIMVVSRYASNDPRTEALGAYLVGLARTFAKHSNVQVAVGGPEGGLGDLTAVTDSRLWLDIAVVAIAIMIVLALALRALLAPVVATGFGLLVAAATFGVLRLLFGGSTPPLGGPGYLDPVTIISVFTIAFCVAVVFSTLLLMRTREEYVSGSEGGDAVRRGVRQTAAATVGAGLVMIATVVPFAITDLINVRELGIGTAVAVLIVMLVVVPVLLPGAEAALGRFAWWPTVSPSGTPPAPRRSTPRRPEVRIRPRRHSHAHP